MRINGLGEGENVAAMIPPLVVRTTGTARAAASFWPVQPRQGEGALIFWPSAVPVRTFIHLQHAERLKSLSRQSDSRSPPPFPWHLATDT